MSGHRVSPVGISIASASVEQTIALTLRQHGVDALQQTESVDKSTFLDYFGINKSTSLNFFESSSDQTCHNNDQNNQRVRFRVLLTRDHEHDTHTHLLIRASVEVAGCFDCFTDVCTSSCASIHSCTRARACPGTHT